MTIASPNSTLSTISLRSMANATALRSATSLNGSLARLKCRVRQLPPTAVKTLTENGIKVRDRSTAVPDTVRITIGTPEENDALLATLTRHLS